MKKSTAGPKYQCTNCGDIIQSMHRHDMVACKCWQSSHMTWYEMSELERSIVQPSTILTGFAIDGGSDYTKINGLTGIPYVDND